MQKNFKFDHLFVLNYKFECSYNTSSYKDLKFYNQKWKIQSYKVLNLILEIRF